MIAFLYLIVCYFAKNVEFNAMIFVYLGILDVASNIIQYYAYKMKHGFEKSENKQNEEN